MTRDRPLLSVSDLSKRFGGLLALVDCSFDVEHGQVFGVIGPNGSGKSTLFNIICGLERPDRGSVAFNGRSVLGTFPSQLAHRGIGRTFQIPRVFGDLTLAENIQVPLTQFGHHSDRSPLDYLAEIGLADLHGVLAKDVSHGQQKLLEFAMVSAMNANLLLLDEPTAGVNPKFAAHIQQIICGFRDRGATVLLVEHTLRVVDAICDAVIVLDQGRIAARGAPSELKAMPDVRKAYYLL